MAFVDNEKKYRVNTQMLSCVGLKLKNMRYDIIIFAHFCTCFNCKKIGLVSTFQLIAGNVTREQKRYSCIQPYCMKQVSHWLF